MSAALRAREEAALARIADALDFKLNPGRLKADELEEMADRAASFRAQFDRAAAADLEEEKETAFQRGLELGRLEAEERG